MQKNNTLAPKVAIVPYGYGFKPLCQQSDANNEVYENQ